MSNNSVIGCEGILLDSGNGTPAGNYDHNEDYIFTICLPGNGQISLSFAAFCLEEPYDYLYIYDGADTTAAVLVGPLTDVTIPQPITSTGSCMTIYFHSDANVACSGWLAQWTSEIDEPVLPTMSLLNSNPTCSTTVVTVNFSSPILCDSVLPANFTLGGTINQTILAATPLNCQGDSTTSIQLQLSPGLNQSGYYVVAFQTTITDDCQNIWDLSSSDTLAVIDCPLSVTLSVDDITICQGQCTNIDADPLGGNFLNYSYTWTPTLPNGDGPFQVCPTQTTLYTVTVTDGLQSATDTITVFVAPAPTITSQTVVCESAAPIILTANPTGGTWEGNGIIDSLAGLFDPSITGAGTFTLNYYDGNGCPVDFQITVNPIDAGLDEAACPGTAAFQVSGFSPAGGTWSGPNITPNGLFNPINVGNFVVTYTLPNGCTDTKTIHVQNINLTPIDTVCESLANFDFTFTPIGGVWSGTGIVNSYWGTFSPDVSNEGLFTLTYTLQGCAQSFDIFVKDINVDWGFTTCPSEAPYIISPYPTPAGGVWSAGLGIINPNTGLYSPAFCTSGWCPDSLSYTVNGCSDYMTAYVVQTAIFTDTMYFCPNDTAILLDWDHIKNTPWDGTWTGTGVTDPDFPGTFDPVVAGPGVHVLHYMANTCEDSVVMIVRPIATPNDTSVCELSPAFALHSVSPGGIWLGQGITDVLTGIFNPQITGVGTFLITYTSPDTCISTMNVTVFPLQTPTITGLSSSYCWKPASSVLIGNPAGGTFSGPGIVGNSFFPLQAGVGQHIITYTYGTGVCQKSGIAITNVSPPLVVTANTTQDSICFGEYAQISAQASNGGSLAYTYTWDNGLGIGATKPVSPQVPTSYIVTANDGCSSPASDTVEVFVYQPFSLDFSVTDTACFGLPGAAVVLVNGSSSYNYSWHTNPPQLTDTLTGEAYHAYNITVTDSQTGCLKEATTLIPGYPYVHAAFLTNPTDECALITNPVFNFIDMSSGAIKGTWTFGDGTSEPYLLGEQPTHIYSDTGHFVITLAIENQGACKDFARDTICIIPEHSNLFIPNAFSPNNDNLNDEWFVVTNGVEKYELRIFDRWGNILFFSEDPTWKWDGKYKGIPCPEGVYTFFLKVWIYSDNPRINYGAVYKEKKGNITLIR